MKPASAADRRWQRREARIAERAELGTFANPGAGEPALDLAELARTYEQLRASIGRGIAERLAPAMLPAMLPPAPELPELPRLRWVKDRDALKVLEFGRNWPPMPAPAPTAVRRWPAGTIEVGREIAHRLPHGEPLRLLPMRIEAVSCRTEALEDAARVEFRLSTIDVERGRSDHVITWRNPPLTDDAQANARALYEVLLTAFAHELQECLRTAFGVAVINPHPGDLSSDHVPAQLRRGGV